MPEVARLESTLAFNDVAFTQGIERAEKRAQTFAGRVEGSFQGLFRRTPGRRAERALGGLLGDIATGNATQGIAMFAGKLTGLGLAAGVGIGAAVELFTHLHSSVVEVTKAHDELDKQMNKPLGLTSIEGLGKAIENLREKQSTFTHGLTNYLADIFKKPLVQGSIGIFDLGKSQIEEERQNQDAIDKRQAAERLRGRTELVRANVLSGLEGNPERRALAELRFKFDDRRKELMSNPDKGTEQRLQALDVEQDIAEKNFRLSKKASDIKLDAEEKIQRLIGKGLDKESERKMRTLAELEVLKAEIAGAPTGSKEARQLNIAKLAKENELRALAPAPESGNPFQQGTLSARDFERQQDTAKFNSQFASFGMSQQELDKNPSTTPQSQDVKKAIDQTNALLTKIFLTPSS